MEPPRDEDKYIHDIERRAIMLEKVFTLAVVVTTKYFSPIKYNMPLNEDMGALRDALEEAGG
jgi:hypothetical protein